MILIQVSEFWCRIHQATEQRLIELEEERDASKLESNNLQRQLSEKEEALGISAAEQRALEKSVQAASEANSELTQQLEMVRSDHSQQLTGLENMLEEVRGESQAAHDKIRWVRLQDGNGSISELAHGTACSASH